MSSSFKPSSGSSSAACWVETGNRKTVLGLGRPACALIYRYYKYNHLIHTSTAQRGSTDRDDGWIDRLEVDLPVTTPPQQEQIVHTLGLLSFLRQCFQQQLGEAISEVA